MDKIIKILLEIKNEITASHLHNKEVFSLQEFCNYANITLDSGHKLTQQRLIPFSRPGGKKIYINRQDAIAYLQQNPVESSSSTERKTNQYFLNAKTVA